jgi:hypothetical protein
VYFVTPFKTEGVTIGAWGIFRGLFLQRYDQVHPSRGPMKSLLLVGSFGDQGKIFSPVKDPPPPVPVTSLPPHRIAPRTASADGTPAPAPGDAGASTKSASTTAPAPAPISTDGF